MRLLRLAVGREVKMCPRKAARRRCTCYFSGPIAGLASHTNTSRAHDPAAMLWPSGLKATEMTVPVGPRKACSSRPVAGSKIRTERSRPSTASREPSGLKATHQTSPSCGDALHLTWPLATSRSATVPSSDPVAKLRSSGLKDKRATERCALARLECARRLSGAGQTGQRGGGSARPLAVSSWELVFPPQGP